MEMVQIFGLIAFSICAICGSVLLCKWMDSKRRTDVEMHRIDKEHNERIATDNSWAMWQNERSMRIQAETREGIAREQLRKERLKTARLEKLLKAAEGKTL